MFERAVLTYFCISCNLISVLSLDQERVEHQQQYIDLLQSEKRDLEQRLEKTRSQSQHKVGFCFAVSPLKLELIVDVACHVLS